jgi:hypothetical protein
MIALIANSALVFKTTDGWVLETLAKRASKPNKITAAS